jgi:hypothetical protein
MQLPIIAVGAVIVVDSEVDLTVHDVHLVTLRIEDQTCEIYWPTIIKIVMQSASSFLQLFSLGRNSISG